MKYALSLFIIVSALTGCGKTNETSTEVSSNSTQATTPVLIGKWITEADGSIMQDPQTSGLAVWRDKLVSISDGSATESQRRRIHVIDPQTAQLLPKPEAMTMSSRVRRSCFANYLSGEPDLEALTVDPKDDSVFYTITEDATRTGALSPRCQQKYTHTGSTDYPSVLVRIKRNESGSYSMTHVKPLRFAPEFEIGNFPNDGIEGLTISPEGLLYLGLEKDKQGKARIFNVQLNDAFWNDSSFADVTEPNLQLPEFLQGNHPVNGLTLFSDPKDINTYLIAVARNDNEIWIIDTTGSKPTKRIEFDFAAQITGESQCGATEMMDNASIEGIAVIGSTLWLVNDPWKRNYLKNIQCIDNAENYKAMAPLLFSTPIKETWLPK